MGCKVSKINLSENDFRVYLESIPLDDVCKTYITILSRTGKYISKISRGKSLTEEEKEKFNFLLKRIEITRAIFSLKYNMLDNTEKIKYEESLKIINTIDIKLNSFDHLDTYLHPQPIVNTGIQIGSGPINASILIPERLPVANIQRTLQ